MSNQRPSRQEAAASRAADIVGALADQKPILAYSIGDLVEAGVGSRTKLYEEIKNGKLATKKQGARTLILPEAVKQYLASLPDGGSHARAA
jgi:hypothetical protein